MKLLPRAFQVLCHSRLLLECQICFRLPAGGFEREGQGRLRREPLPGLGDLWDLQTFKFKVCGCWCILCQVLQFQFGDVGSAAGAMQSAAFQYLLTPTHVILVSCGVTWLSCFSQRVGLEGARYAFLRLNTATLHFCSARISGAEQSNGESK